MDAAEKDWVVWLNVFHVPTHEDTGKSKTWNQLKKDN